MSGTAMSMEVRDYTALGWACFPLRWRSKEPLPRTRGFLDATLDPSWRRTHPNCNIGLSCTAATGVLAIDVDPRSGGDISWHTLCQGHDEIVTPRQVTGGGGFHLLFRHPGIACKSVIADGVDVKAAGYVVVEPSVHPSGGAYYWELSAHPTDTPLADLPAWLLELCRAPPTQPVSRLSGSAATCPVALAFARAGRMLRVIDDRKVAVRCPVDYLHSQPSPSGTIVYGPSEAAPRGSFYCSHSHPKLTTREALEMIGEKV